MSRSVIEHAQAIRDRISSLFEYVEKLQKELTDAGSIGDTAREEAATIVAEAKAEAVKIVDDAKAEAARIVKAVKEASK